MHLVSKCREAIEQHTRGLPIIALLLIATWSAHGWAAVVPYIYQGRLTDSNPPSDGLYEIRLQLYDAAAGGNPQGPSSTHTELCEPPPLGPPIPWEFDVFPPNPPDPDFICQVAQPWPPEEVGPWPSTWDPLYLEVAVKRSTDTGFTILSPRQELTATPIAYTSLHAGRAVTLELPWTPTASTPGPLLEVTQTGDGPAAIFKVQPQPEPPLPQPAVEAISSTSAPAIKGSNTTGNGPAACFESTEAPTLPLPPPTVVALNNSSAPTVQATNNGSGSAIKAEAMGTSSTAHGVQASSGSPSGFGLWGQSSATDFTNAGVGGLSTAMNGNGVKGQANIGPLAAAVWGVSANGFGGYFQGKGYFSGNVGLGVIPTTSKLTVAGNLTVSSGGLTVSSGNLTVGGGDLSVSAGGLSVAQELSVGGELTVESDIKKAYTPGMHSRAVPIAYANIDLNGVVTAGTPNVSAVWESGNQRYVITIAGESYSSTGYITTVTPLVTGAPEALFATVSGSTPAGTLRVRIMSSTTGTTGLQRPFQFITYKP